MQQQLLVPTIIHIPPASATAVAGDIVFFVDDYFTVTFTFLAKPFLEYTYTVHVPALLPVTTPFLDTVAMLLSELA